MRVRARVSSRSLVRGRREKRGGQGSVFLELFHYYQALGTDYFSGAHNLLSLLDGEQFAVPREELYAIVVLFADVPDVHRDGALRRAQIWNFGDDASHFIVAQ